MSEVPDIIDLDPYLRVWAEDNFRRVDKNPLKGKQTRLEIIKEKMKTRPLNESYKETTEELHERENPTEVVLKKMCINKTDSEIKKEYEIERETIATATTSMEKGYSCPDLPEIVLNTPEEIRGDEAAPSLRPVFKTNGRQETHDVIQKIKFSSKTTVTVPGRKTYKASSTLKEINRSFVSTANIQFRGTVVARMIDVETNECLPMTIKVEELFKRIMAHTGIYAPLPKLPVKTDEEGKVYWPIQGRVVFNYLVGEETVVDDVTPDEQIQSSNR